jgi:acyl carrier protein
MAAASPSTVDTVRRLIDQQLNFAVHGLELRLDDNLWDLGMTSLTCLGLMLSIEDSFGIELPEEVLKEATFRSVNSIVAAVEGSIGSPEASSDRPEASSDLAHGPRPVQDMPATG